MCQRKHPRLLFHSFFLPYPYPLDKSQFLKHHSAEGAVICRYGDSKKDAGGGSLSPEDMETRGLFKSLSAWRLHCPLGAVGLHLPQKGPLASGGCGSVQRGMGISGPKGGFVGWRILPSSIRPRQSICETQAFPGSRSQWPEGNRVSIFFFLIFILYQCRDDLDFPGSSAGKESACNVGDMGSIPGLGTSPGRGHSNPLQYSCLENPHGQRSLGGHGSQRVGHD